MGYDNHFLFSETYLNETLKKMNKNEITEADEQFENILSWYREYKDAWELYEDILIDTLGFSKELDGQYRILCSDSTKPVAIAYFLKNESDLGSTVKGKYYAVDAVQYAKKHKVNWAIVTNGICWRLYYAENVSPYEFYFEVNTGNALETGKADSHSRALYRMFSAQYYAHNENNICLMDAFKEESDSENEKIEDILRSKSESILKGLCYGLKDNMNLSSFDDDTRNQIYGDAIVLLYRLLFLGYAEARNLLPVVAGDPDYQDSFSALCETARDYYMSGQLNTVGDDYDLWNRLDSQLRTYVDKKYNGGLFSNDDKAAIKHFVTCGMKEGRQGSSQFDWNVYRLNNADLSRLFGSNKALYYVHYVQYGKKEGRKATGTPNMTGATTVYNGVDYRSVYDFNYYINKYPDIKRSFGATDENGVLKHFVTYGLKENRQAKATYDKNEYAKLRTDAINAANSNGKTPIMGTSTVTKAQMIKYYNKVAKYPDFYKNSDAPTIDAFVQIYIEECAAEGVRADIAFAQAMDETGYLRFGGLVHIEDYNFAGIGATDSANNRNIAQFTSVRMGVRAQVQHLKAYASKDALKNPTVDPRFHLVSRGSAPYVEWLSIPNNPYGRGWASNKTYAEDILRILSNIKAQ